MSDNHLPSLTSETALAELADTEKDYLSKENPRSLYNVAAKFFKDAMDRVPERYFSMKEEELEAQLKPTSLLNCLRFRLWEQYYVVTDNKHARLKTHDIVKGLCTPAYFNRAVLRNPMVVAWLLRPPRDYMESANEALNFGIRKIRDILEFPLWDSKGNPDIKIAKLQIDVVKMLDARLKGAPLQRIEERRLSVTANAKDVQAIQEMTSMDELEQKLKKLRTLEERESLMMDERPKLTEFKSGGIAVEPETLPVRKTPPIEV